MALTKIRRLLIAFVGFLLVINLVLLGVARYGQSQAASRITYNIVAWIDEADQASSLKSAVEAPGRTVSLTEAPREVKTPAGFRLVMSGKPALLGPVAESLKVKKRPVKLVADGTEIQWGGPFPDRAKAEAKAKAIEKSDGVRFEVKENFKVSTKPAHKLVVEGLDEATAEEIQALLTDKGAEAEVVPAEDIPSESSAG